MTALWVAVTLCGGVDGHLDLFMNETETKRLLGESVALLCGPPP